MKLPALASKTMPAVACGVLLALPSCQLPKLGHPDPAPDLPADFNGATSPDNSGQLKIEEFFGDPVLIGLIRQALAGNQELKILAQDIRIANTEFLARRGALFPFVTVRADGGLDKPSLYTIPGAAENQLLYPGRHHFPDPLPNVLVAANFTWQLDVWRKLRNARDAASLRYLASAEGRNYVVTRVAAEVAENYYGLLALDTRLQILDTIIAIQEKSLGYARLRFEAGRTDVLPVRRFEAEVRKNQSEKLIVRQEIIETENRINFLAGRFPQPVERPAVPFLDLNLHALGVGVPSQLLQNRPDIRQAERELGAAGLDVKVARAEFFPTFVLTGGVGYEAFNPKYLFATPESLVANVAGGLVAPLVNRTAIAAVFGAANARQLQAAYNYQRVVLNAFTEVVNRVTMEQNYRRSIEVKKQQLEALGAAVAIANQLFQAVRIDYLDVLIAQRDLLDAQTVTIDTKRQQLSAVVNAYQALGGGGGSVPAFDAEPAPAGPPPAPPKPAPAGEPLPPPKPIPAPAGQALPPPAPVRP